jgi:hypothetical protein
MLNWDFLHDGDESFGMFYPRHYTLAGFADHDAAESAAKEIAASGFAATDVHVVRGHELVSRIEQQEADHGWLDRIKAGIAEFIGTETYFIDQDITLAKRGGSFVLVYTPDEEDGARLATVLRANNAEYARRYLNMAIERLIEPPAEIRHDADQERHDGTRGLS